MYLFQNEVMSLTFYLLSAAIVLGSESSKFLCILVVVYSYMPAAYSLHSYQPFVVALLVGSYIVLSVY